MTKKVSKISNLTVNNGELSNTRSWHDFLDQETLSVYCSRDEWRQRLIHTMMKWSEKTTSLEVLQFCMEYKIPYNTLKQWSELYPDIKSAYSNVKLALACHRRIGSMNKKLDGSYAYKDMHIYDPEWIAVNKYHSDMKKEEEKQPHTFIINTDKPRIVSKEQMLKDSETQE